MHDDLKAYLAVIIAVIIFLLAGILALSTNELDNNLKIQECVNTGAEPKACKCAFTGCIN